jgi:hypothetical protein
LRNALRRPTTTRRCFCIAATKDVSLVVSELPNGDSTIFSSERELSVRVARWPGSRLVQVWNHLPRVNPIKRFADRRTAIHRIWRAIQEGHVDEITGAGSQKITSKEARRSNTKTAQIINLLRQPAGATLQAIMDLTGWQAHSVRGFLSAQSKKRGLRVESLTRSGQRAYRIRP